MTYTLETAYCLDGSNDVDLVIGYNYSKGYPERGPYYSSGGEPSEPPDVEVLTVMVDGRPATDVEFDAVVTSDRLWQQMVDNAVDAA